MSFKYSEIIDEIRLAIVLAKTIKYTLFILQGINNSSANNTIALLNKQTDK